MFSDLITLRPLETGLSEVAVNDLKILFLDEEIIAIRDPRMGTAWCIDLQARGTLPKKLKGVISQWMEGRETFLPPASVEEHIIPAFLSDSAGDFPGRYPPGWETFDMQQAALCPDCGERHEKQGEAPCPLFS